MNDTTSTTAQRLSFNELLKQYKVVRIPIIQRDYAQGRETAQEVRSSFLGALYKYLDENKPNRDLDFVYGSLTETDEDKYFIPLDGQQRLTTLFLLHWYLAQISNNMDKLREVLLTDNKISNFTYETRPSSSMFCDALMTAKDIDFINLEENSLSKTIKNSSWYYLSWKYDPTIQSMLTMLDAIHDKFKTRGEFFERLMDNHIITFWFLNLNDFKLTDDLYIKMNSRGKPLTSFENFKAKFEQYIDIEIKSDKKYFLKFIDTNKEVYLKEYFSYNIDTKWANLFWNYRKLSVPEDTFDNELMNFIRIIFASQYAVNSNVTLKNKDDKLEYLLGTNVAKKYKNYSDNISFNKYEELNALTEKSILYLVDAFNCLTNGNEEIKIYLSKNYKYYFDEKYTFKNALRGSFETNHERLCFHAYVSYLITNPNDRTGIEQWMRVIHNLTHPENTIIDNASEVAAAVKLIEGMLPESNNILEYLKQEGEKIVGSPHQILEEKIKAHLITRNGNWTNKIELIEKNKYFNGQIGFLLEFSGIIGYYNENKNCNWNERENTDYFEKFSTYADKADKVFDESYDNRNTRDFIFERAVLTKGDYLTSTSQGRKNLLSTNVVKNNIKRDHSWKRLLRISDEAEWKDKRLLVKNVFDDKRFNKDNLEASLKSICKDITNSWRDYFITCPELIKYCKQGFIHFVNENNILLYGESQSNHMHIEMYSYYVWKKYFESQKIPLPVFKNKEYKEVKSIEDTACIIISEFCRNDIYYQINIYGCPDLYKIIFLISKGTNHNNEYGDDIKNILEQLKFEQTSDGYYCSFTHDNEEKMLEKLELFVKSLYKLTGE